MRREKRQISWAAWQTPSQRGAGADWVADVDRDGTDSGEVAPSATLGRRSRRAEMLPSRRDSSVRADSTSLAAWGLWAQAASVTQVSKITVAASEVNKFFLRTFTARSIALVFLGKIGQ